MTMLDPDQQHADPEDLAELLDALEAETNEDRDELLTDLLVHTYLSVAIQNA